MIYQFLLWVQCIVEPEVVLHETWCKKCGSEVLDPVLDFFLVQDRCFWGFLWYGIVLELL